MDTSETMARPPTSSSRGKDTSTTVTKLKPLCVDAVRSHFPIFDNCGTRAIASANALAFDDLAKPQGSLQLEKPSPENFFENAGGTFAVRYVVERLQHFYSSYKVQPYGRTGLQQSAGDAMDLGRQRMAELLGLAHEDVVLGPSTTQNFNTLATGFIGVLAPGDEIIVSEQDHEANIGGWLRAAKLAHATVRIWEVEKTAGQLQLDALEQLVNERTRLVCVTHSSNIIGSINPLAEIATRLQNSAPQRIYLIADGVSYAPHGLPDIPGLAQQGVDAYSFSTYKTFGTHLGVMYIKPELSEQLTPQCHYFNTEKTSYRFDAAGPDHASIAALAGIADYFDKLYEQLGGDSLATTFDRGQALSQLFKQYEHKLVTPVLECLNDKSVRILGTSSSDATREANIAFISDRMTSTDINQALAAAGMAAGNGDFYAPRVLQSLGVSNLEDGAVRLSFAHYNSATEVRNLVSVLDAVLPA